MDWVGGGRVYPARVPVVIRPSRALGDPLADFTICGDPE